MHNRYGDAFHGCYTAIQLPIAWRRLVRVCLPNHLVMGVTRQDEPDKHMLWL